MSPIHTFFENYKNATAGINIFGKIFIALILSFIFIAVIFAFLGILPEFFGY